MSAEIPPSLSRQPSTSNIPHGIASHRSATPLRPRVNAMGELNQILDAIGDKGGSDTTAGSAKDSTISDTPPPPQADDTIPAYRPNENANTDQQEDANTRQNRRHRYRDPRDYDDDRHHFNRLADLYSQNTGQSSQNPSGRPQTQLTTTPVPIERQQLQPQPLFQQQAPSSNPIDQYFYNALQNNSMFGLSPNYLVSPRPFGGMGIMGGGTASPFGLGMGGGLSSIGIGAPYNSFATNPFLNMTGITGSPYNSMNGLNMGGASSPFGLGMGTGIGMPYNGLDSSPFMNMMGGMISPYGSGMNGLGLGGFGSPFGLGLGMGMPFGSWF